MNERTVQHFYENGWRKLTVVHISEVKEELNKKDCQISKLERKIQELEAEVIGYKASLERANFKMCEKDARIKELEECCKWCKGNALPSAPTTEG